MIAYGPFSSPYMNKIMERFGPPAFRRTSVCMEFEHFLKVIKAGGNTCLEIGSYNGISTAILSQYFNKVIGISLDNDQTIIRPKIIEHLGVKNVEFRDIKSNEEKPDLINSIGFDFCYIDGDHENDTLSDFNMVKHCKKVLFHEYWPLQPSVWNLVNSLPEKEVTRAQFDCLAYWHG